MKLTKQQLRNIIKEELTPGEKGIAAARLDAQLANDSPNMKLHSAIMKAIENLANVFVRVSVRQGADELYAETLAERLVDDVAMLVSDLNEEFDE